VQSLSTSTTDYKGSMDAMLKIAKYEGIRGLYKGYIPTLVSFGPYSALYFMFYETFKERIILHNRRDTKLLLEQNANPNELSFLQLIGASAAAGSIASWVTSPLDLAKLRLQIQRAGGAAARTQKRGGDVIMYSGDDRLFKTGICDGRPPGAVPRGNGACLAFRSINYSYHDMLRKIPWFLFAAIKLNATRSSTIITRKSTVPDNALIFEEVLTNVICIC